MLRGWFTLSLLGLMASALTATGGEASARTTLTIPGMPWGGCAAGVRIQLKKTEGVTAYEVSFEKGEAEVSYNPAKITPEKIAASVSKTGFAASVKEPRAGACSSSSCEGDCCKDARRAATG